jgi:hypothetical protein
MDEPETLPLWADWPLRVVVTLAAFLLAFMIRRGWHKVSQEYDRSMLIRLGVDKDSTDYAWAPVIIGPFPFSDLGGDVRSNLDVRNVVGFVVGNPKWLKAEDIKRVLKNPNPDYHKPGFYAYCVIQWEHAAMVKRFADQWFHIRRTRYTGNKAEYGMRERIFVGFGTDAMPDADGTLPLIANIKTGPLASLRYQPYLKGDFKPEDIKMRALAPQTRLLIGFKNIFTKEWRDA